MLLYKISEKKQKTHVTLNNNFKQYQTFSIRGKTREHDRRDATKHRSALFWYKMKWKKSS